MALSEVWTWQRTPNTTVPVWAERRLNSPLATVGALLDGQDPISTVTVRMRYRRDITSGSTLVGPDGRLWRVSETLEIGRRRFLDLACSTYPLARIIPDVTPDPEPPTPGYVAPAGWTIEANGGVCGPPEHRGRNGRSGIQR